MKKLLFFILLSLLVALSASADVDVKVLQAPSVVCTASGTLVSCYALDDASYYNTTNSQDTTAQQYVKNSATITICQIDVRMDKFNGGTTCTNHLEIWEADQSAQIGADSNTFNTTSTTPTTFEVTFPTPVTVSGTDFIIVNFNDSCDSGNAGWEIDDEENVACYEDTNYDLEAGAVDKNEDAVFKVYTQ